MVVLRLIISFMYAISVFSNKTSLVVQNSCKTCQSFLKIDSIRWAAIRWVTLYAFFIVVQMLDFCLSNGYMMGWDLYQSLLTETSEEAKLCMRLAPSQNNEIRRGSIWSTTVSCNNSLANIYSQFSGDSFLASILAIHFYINSK